LNTAKLNTAKKMTLHLANILSIAGKVQILQDEATQKRVASQATRLPVQLGASVYRWYTMVRSDGGTLAARLSAEQAFVAWPFCPMLPAF
jgi:hypothetical protein